MSENISSIISKLWSFANVLRDVRGYSARNLWDMKRFYEQYQHSPKLRQLVAEIPWGHNLLIINKIKHEDAREYYIKASKAASVRHRSHQSPWGGIFVAVCRCHKYVAPTGLDGAAGLPVLQICSPYGAWIGASPHPL